MRIRRMPLTKISARGEDAYRPMKFKHAVKVAQIYCGFLNKNLSQDAPNELSVRRGCLIKTCPLGEDA
jgi:hypothetical protein